MKYYESIHFTLEELVPPEIYLEYEYKSLRFLDQNLLKMIDGIRNFFDVPVYINNWDSGGDKTLRGFRPPATKIGAKLSQHKFGRAADMDIEGYTAEEARQLILKNQKSPLLNWITCIEDGVSWLHCDIRNIKTETIILFTP
jgi:hypothetical protein